MAEVEGSGVPTVSLITTPYISIWKAGSSVAGLPHLPYVVAGEDTLTMKPNAEVHALADTALDRILENLTHQGISEAGVSGTVSLAKLILGQEVTERLVFEGSDRLQAWQEMNRQFLKYQWGDGFPLVPPTPESVKEMLTGTRRSPSDVVATMEPSYGIATVEKIAINAVMAGCMPEHLPVILAAVEAMNDRLFSLRHVAMASSPFTPFLVVNGPYAKKIGINAGRCCFGPGAPSAVNTVIGRAIRLIMMNVGGTWPGITDQDSHGHPNKYSMCIGEMEEQSPWPPLHVERGFRPDESTVTVFAAHGSVASDIKDSEPGPLLEQIARMACNVGPQPAGMWTRRPVFPHSDAEFGREPEIADQHICIIFSLDHANIFRKHNWPKSAVKEFLHQRVKAPVKYLSCYNFGIPTRVRPDLRWLVEYPEMEIPLYRRPESYQLVVAGFGSGDSQVIYSGKHSITRKIDVD